MYIKKISVQNFRQLKDIELYFQENMSILAGPNNSGKTSLILLLKKMLLESKFVFSQDDYNVYDKYIWSNKIYEALTTSYNNNASTKDKDKIMREFLGSMFPIEDEPNKSITLPELTVKLQIDCNSDDDISNFANYIMDLDASKNSFYFIYKITLNKDLFFKEIQNNWNKIYNRLEKNQEGNNKSSIDKIISNIYCCNLVSKCYFTDEKYKISSEISSLQEFRNLFNFKYIEAARPVNDSLEKDEHSLSNILISLASKEETWKTKINELPDDVLNVLGSSKIKDQIEQISTIALNDTISSIEETNGGHTGKLCLNLDVSEENVQNLIKSTINAQYSIYGQINKFNYNLNETSQGLGYSNLIYIHTQIQDYLKSKNKLKVNFLVIEEPESHMHPQMQYVFANKLLEKYDQEKLQGLITTHSSEIVRGSSMERLRVIRDETLFNSKIYDLSNLISNLNKKIKTPKNPNDEDLSLIKDYKTFFENIGISELIFADAAILFEGDTERLYLKKIVTLPKFEKLQQKYIAYIQVGGAYAHKFKLLLEYLKIKSLIITDIDYDKSSNTKKKILQATTTNEAIMNFYRENKECKKKITIEDLYNWINENKHIVTKTKTTSLNNDETEHDLIYLAFQTDKENYTRTLEAAMLSKAFGISGYKPCKRDYWVNKKKEYSLNYSIPKITGRRKNFTLVDILKATSNTKTNFMYSVILNKHAEEMLPEYIEGGLEWLMK
ncbi:hypothetical protein DWV12_14590 [Clostridium botulinum]|uniref:AAA family ATPase n=1 Tax=Clostridium botulinum TaxID=1491 RepID=UPI00217CC712|nr:ATP-dependent endonuclease [Clostridium botulinum]MCS6103537.1 hypothetical protein [Clostridium botulinum]MCS6108574.1 hypothetical protein [Clostridium botulinum]